MLDKEKIKECVQEIISDKDIFLVDVSVSPDNRVVVEIDSNEGIDIEDCEEITHGILDAFDRDVEDYELEVGSSGLTAPFKVPQQYIKNIGNPVEVLTKDGQKLYGTLVIYDEQTSSFTIEIQRKVKEPGKKRPEIKTEPLTFSPVDVKYIKVDFK